MNPKIRRLAALNLWLAASIGCKSMPDSTLRSQEPINSEKPAEPKMVSGKKTSLILDLLTPTEDGP